MDYGGEEGEKEAKSLDHERVISAFKSKMKPGRQEFLVEFALYYSILLDF